MICIVENQGEEPFVVLLAPLLRKDAKSWLRSAKKSQKKGHKEDAAFSEGFAAALEYIAEKEDGE